MRTRPSLRKSHDHLHTQGFPAPWFLLLRTPPAPKHTSNCHKDHLLGCLTIFSGDHCQFQINKVTGLGSGTGQFNFWKASIVNNRFSLRKSNLTERRGKRFQLGSAGRAGGRRQPQAGQDVLVKNRLVRAAVGLRSLMPFLGSKTQRTPVSWLRAVPAGSANFDAGRWGSAQHGPSRLQGHRWARSVRPKPEETSSCPIFATGSEPGEPCRAAPTFKHPKSQLCLHGDGNHSRLQHQSWMFLCLKPSPSRPTMTLRDQCHRYLSTRII